MQYHSRNFTYTYFFKRVWFDTRMKSSTYEFIHEWNVPWNFWNLRRMNSYTYEMFRETFHTCYKSNAYEIVVFDWSMPIIVTSFNMWLAAFTKQRPNLTLVCATYQGWSANFVCTRGLRQINTFDCYGATVVASRPHDCDVAQSLSWRKTLRRALRGLSKTGVCRWSSNGMPSFHTRMICNAYDFIRVWFVTRMICNVYDFIRVWFATRMVLNTYTF